MGPSFMVTALSVAGMVAAEVHPYAPTEACAGSRPILGRVIRHRIPSMRSSHFQARRKCHRDRLGQVDRLGLTGPPALAKYCASTTFDACAPGTSISSRSTFAAGTSGSGEFNLFFLRRNGTHENQFSTGAAIASRAARLSIPLVHQAARRHLRERNRRDDRPRFTLTRRLLQARHYDPAFRALHLAREDVPARCRLPCGIDEDNATGLPSGLGVVSFIAAPSRSPGCV
jgi:hypothetical protein